MHRTIVIKVGTSTLLGGRRSNALGLDGELLMRLCLVLRALLERGWRPVVVTSGAVGMGRARLGTAGPTIAEKQAAAAVGQGLLMHAYEAMLAPLGLTSAQLLLTRADLADRQRYLNARNTLAQLLAASVPVVPVINENDSVAVDELKFGDNDTLSALVANLVSAGWLAILSDVAGLFTADPTSDPEAELIAEVAEVTPEIEALAGGSRSGMGTGGMATKLQAARIATASGIPMVLLSGREPEQLLGLVAGEPIRGTRFLAKGNNVEHYKRWLAFGAQPAGTLAMDTGAARAILEQGKSLLPAGIRETSGEFSAGELVLLAGPDGRAIARGVTNYSAAELTMIRGRKSAEIEALLGYKVADEAVHRDHMVLL